LNSNYVGAQTQNNQLVLEINPSPENPRNSEGVFIGLKNGSAGQLIG